MVLEYTDNFEAPDDCLATETSKAFWSLYSWGVSDAAIASYLASSFGTPTYQLTGSITPAPIPSGGGLYAVKWAETGKSESSITMTDAGGPNTMVTRIPDRFYWGNGTGLSAFDLAYTGTGTFFGAQPVAGTLSPPMKLAEAFPTFAGRGDSFFQVGGTGEFRQWSDQSCGSLQPF